jgi:hypothetical protein
MREEILALAADMQCGSSAECAFIALGVKPCGGPWRYVVYPAMAANASVLVDKIAQYNELNAVLNKRYSWVSDCMVVTPPNAVECRDGKCVAVER